MRIKLRGVMASGVLAALAACGGGGSSSPTTGAMPGSLNGLAATGAAIANATVSAKCVAGPLISGSTDANGAFTLVLTAAHTAPCMLQVAGGTPNVTLYSFATAAGRVNLSPLSDMVVAKALGSDPAAAFASFDSAKGSTITGGLAAAKTYVQTQLAAITGAGTADPLTSTFSVGGADDKVLDALGAALTAAGKGIADLRSGAQTGASLSGVVPAFLGAPAGASATAASASQISLNWSAVPAATGYNVYASTSPNVLVVAGNKLNAQPIATAGGYSVASLAAGTAYYFKVTAVNSVAPESAGSAEVTATTSGSGGGGGGTPTLGVTWTARHAAELGFTPNLNKVAWSGSLLVGVGHDVAGVSHIRTSSDGLSWTEQSFGSATYLRDVAWSGSQFVAVGYVQAGSGRAVVLTSPDGVSWTSRNSGAVNNLQAVACSASLCVAVGSVGTVIASTDNGATWSVHTSGLSTSLTNIALMAVATDGAGNWVAVGNSAGTVIYSTNNTSGWTIVTVGGSLAYWDAAAWSGSKFLILSPNGANATSADGGTWTTHASLGHVGYGAVWDGSEFVAVGGASISTSADGASWTDRSPNGLSANIQGVAWTGTRLVAVGSDAILVSP